MNPGQPVYELVYARPNVLTVSELIPQRARVHKMMDQVTRQMYLLRLAELTNLYGH